MSQISQEREKEIINALASGQKLEDVARPDEIVPYIRLRKQKKYGSYKYNTGSRHVVNYATMAAIASIVGVAGLVLLFFEWQTGVAAIIAVVVFFAANRLKIGFFDNFFVGTILLITGFRIAIFFLPDVKSAFFATIAFTVIKISLDCFKAGIQDIKRNTKKDSEKHQEQE